MIPRFKPWLGWGEFRSLFQRNKGAVERFEKEFAEAFKAVDAVAFPYGRSAQWAFFKAMGLENAEIIMPAYTCSVVAHAITLSGNRPCFIDINLDDYNMNLDLIPKVINENTRAIIATHTFGYPQNLDKLESIVKEAEKRYGHKIWLMQDCCHAFGAEWNERMIGTSGDVAVYAFNISKLMTSIFGGMLTFQDKTLADEMRKWRDAHYRQASLWKSVKRRFYLLAIYIAFNEKIYGLTWWIQEKTPLLNRLTKSYHLDDKIHFPPDYLDQMLDVEAAVGLVQLKKYPEIIKRRCATAEWYARNLPKIESMVYPFITNGATYSHYVIHTNNRDNILDYFSNNNIQLGKLIEYSVPELKSYKTDKQFDNSFEASENSINLPISVSIENNKIKVCKLFCDAYGNRQYHG